MTAPTCAACTRPVGDNARLIRGKISEAARWWNTARPLTHPLATTRRGLVVKATQCSVDGCEKRRDGKNRMCSMHITRLRRHGELAPTGPTHAPVADRFWRFVVPVSPLVCWEWQGSRNNHGYGRMGPTYAHRVSFEIHHRPLADGEHVRHACDNPPCVNPAHLLPGSPADNARDKVERGRSVAVLNGAKITAEDVRAIRAARAAGARNVDLAAQYGIHRHSISRIVTGRAWGNA